MSPPAWFAFACYVWGLCFTGCNRLSRVHGSVCFFCSWAGTLNCLGWQEEGRSNRFLGRFFSFSCSSKMVTYELVILENLCEIIWEDNGSLSILWIKWELLPSGSTVLQWLFWMKKPFSMSFSACLLCFCLSFFNKLTCFLCFCFPFLIYLCVFINGFSLPCLPLSVGF